LTALLSAESGAAVLPSTLVAGTVGAATGAAAVSASVATLTEGALHMILMTQVKTVTLTAAACLGVAGLVTRSTTAAPLLDTKKGIFVAFGRKPGLPPPGAADAVSGLRESNSL
jgi:hypothetical protein